MKNRIKIVCFVFVVCFLSTTMTGCFDRRELDDLAYPIAIGLDKGDNNFLKLTLQLAVPTAIGTGEGGGGAGGSESISVTTVETPSIYSGLNMINTYLSKQINLSHAKVLVFSEDLAREGMNKYINAILRSREFRPNAFVLVARGKGAMAEKYIRSVKPELEANPAKYYELVLRAYRYTGFTADAQLVNFHHRMTSYDIQPVAVLAGVGTFESLGEIDAEESTFREKEREYPFEGDFKAGDMPKVGEVKSETMGLAVFKGARMVGEIDGEETIYYLMVSGEFGYTYMTLPDPINKDTFVILSVKQSRPPVKKVKMEGDKPVVSVKVKLEADILSIQSGINYESTDKVSVMEESAEEFIKSGIQRYLKRTAEELNSDMCGIGTNMKGKFLTWSDWEKFDWKSKYKDSTFDVSVDLKIRRPGLLVRSADTQIMEGEGK